MILLLEDDPRRCNWFKSNFKGHDLHITKVPDEAITWCCAYQYDRIFLDYDLYDEYRTGTPLEWTGFDLAQWLSENKAFQPNPEIIIHSINPDGALRMHKILSDADFDVRCISYQILQAT